MSRFNRLLCSKSSWLWRYGVAVLVMAATQIVSRWLAPGIGFPGTLFSCAILLSTWFGGVGPGLIVAFLSTLAFHKSFTHLPGGIHREMPRLVMFLISNILFVLLTASQRSAKESLKRARDNLKDTVQELETANEALLQESRERKQTEEALRQAQADITYANRVSSMGELAASLAHEVNQPIAAAFIDADTCSRWLSYDQPDLTEARAAVSRVMQDVRRASEIVKRVRQLFKKEDLQREPVDLNEIIREMLLLLRSEAIQSAILTRVELAANLPKVTGDRVQLQQVLMNLIMNSIDAMKDVDGTRVLTVRSQLGEDGQLLILVSDTGVGLPEQADKIFNSFFTTKTQGTGMGLSISRSIVESHGGRLWAASNSPHGANFYFTLSTDAQVPQ